MIDTPDTNQFVGIPSKQRLSIMTPRKRDALWRSSLCTALKGNCKFINCSFAFKVPDLDSGGSCATEPVSFWREAECIDWVGCVERVKVFAFVEVP